MKRSGVAGVVLWAALCACGDQEVKQFTAEVSEASGVTLLEGLPHQYWEREVFTRELRTRALAHINGYPFYERELSLNDGDAERLKSMLGDAGRYRRWEGEKKCGGYHPDYAVVFAGKHTSSYVMICFGCEEARLASTWVDVRRDMTAIDDVRELLQVYREQRPEKAPPGRAAAAPAISASAASSAVAAASATAGPTAASGTVSSTSAPRPAPVKRVAPSRSNHAEHGF